MRNILFIIKFLMLTMVLNSVAISSNISSIKLAVFDNPLPDPSRCSTKQRFESAYLAGVNTAITVAASNGLKITVKEFFHENNLASVIQQASNAKTWKPDAIIGLNTSNDFIMAKAFFSDQVILSTSATDPALSALPRGFYSLGIPDTSAVDIMINFIHRHYPNANLFITAAAESKESVDFANLLGETYKSIYKDRTVIQKKYLTDDMDHLSFSKLMAGYKNNDVIVIMSIGYDSAIDLMNKISAYVKPDRPIFITSTDNWGDDIIPQKISGSYDAFRIDTIFGGEDTSSYKVFLANYIKIYHNLPRDKISFVTYQTVMSIVDALTHYPVSSTSNRDKKTSILLSYERALANNPNWYRPPYYKAFKLENQKEVFYEKIN